MKKCIQLKKEWLTKFWSACTFEKYVFPQSINNQQFKLPQNVNQQSNF